MTRLKKLNRSYLRKVFTLKTVFYPLVLLLISTGRAERFEKIINKIIRWFGVKKNFHYFIKFRDSGRWFRNKFIIANENIAGEILFPSMTGVHSNFTLLNLLFAQYFWKRYGLKPLLYICNSAFDICTKDGMIKSRRKYPWFCHECFNGYKYIEQNTGIEIIWMKHQAEHFDNIVSNEIEKINKLESLTECIGYTYNGQNIGLFAKKSVMRYFLTGKLAGTREVISVYREFILAALKYSLAFEKTIKERPHLKYVIINNGTLAFEALARFHCEKHGIPYITYETYIGNNSLIYKRNGAVMDLDWSREYEKFRKKIHVDKECRKIVDGFFEGLRKGVGMYAVLNREHMADRLKDSGKYVCLFTNLNYDTAVIDKNHLFPDMEGWIYSVINYWKERRPGITLVIRIHPGEIKLVTASREYLGERIIKACAGVSQIIVFDSTDKVNSYELIKNMEYGLVYASTIGLEIAWSGKTCVVAGLPWFRNEPFVLYPALQEEYFSYIEKLNNGEFSFKPDIEELYRKIYFVYFNRLKRLNGIKLYTPAEEANSVYNNPEEMINNNIEFFEEFRDELFGKE